ncbi:hypothetical protein GII36_00535 [Candidatus Mycosynbacter amalyticus]|uniref:Uncharacterized protein n=1 Tax=Candidatus Mycosynbacter amalyticus TaxID=2665156 RepID=A0A857MKQ3_9BACT|nr:hypothetical protein [Candidatus Mycosynbacter amalyticus]QHN42345.1 hypothetical protein GII36_00535 [Candidatus Mycosynbacter amalyticus]
MGAKRGRPALEGMLYAPPATFWEQALAAHGNPSYVRRLNRDTGREVLYCVGNWANIEHFSFAVVAEFHQPSPTRYYGPPATLYLATGLGQYVASIQQGASEPELLHPAFDMESVMIALSLLAFAEAV